ncbi:hypothetical protein BD324DRAFT_678715 [Kockovaella imperatae]|uniref:Uncharacterized protein n=1 Tax=Kockovaella imperatae TaxID=4999 RepID=A0A1Y1UQ62_9TREE|nr:hypothetical protein BD324DRAFT_678715 [Kockovaella imperatae]ORX39596.1 hypothetical protein BD324DRAFT_678715 [Kockovaella imperatae]
MTTSSLALIYLLPLLASLGEARPISRGAVHKREVPQELSHKRFLTAVQTSLQANNPDNIVDPVFGLLGDAAASQGAGSITDLACLQQATADQAFINAKAAGDVDGMTNALIYRALERNTGKVGLASAICTQTPVNPEIGAVTQHQDPASNGAAATNKAITLALAQQIASVGGDPQLALQSGTFTPGDVTDPTGAGNTCDTEDCIFEQNRLVEDASPAEIDAAVAGSGGTAGTTASGDAGNSAGGNGDNGAATVMGSANAAMGGDNTAATEANAGVATEGAAAGGAVTVTNNAAAAGIDVGQCTDFRMTFAAGLENRGADEFTFIPTDQTNFKHGSAKNPKIISQFMCDTFVNACGKSKATQAACDTVKTTIDGQLDSGALTADQSYADAWLSGLEQAFGVQSTGSGGATGGANAGAAVGAADDAAPGAGGTTADAGNAAQAGTGNTGNAGSDRPNNNANGAEQNGNGNNNAASEGSAAVSAGGNVQTFGGALNGASAPAVIQNTSSNRPFFVGGDTFVNKGAAIQRSCDQQANACANAFNSGSGTAPVSECNAQRQQCVAAGGA